MKRELQHLSVGLFIIGLWWGGGRPVGRQTVVLTEEGICAWCSATRHRSARVDKHYCRACGLKIAKHVRWWRSVLYGKN